MWKSNRDSRSCRTLLMITSSSDWYLIGTNTFNFFIMGMHQFQPVFTGAYQVDKTFKNRTNIFECLCVRSETIKSRMKASSKVIFASDIHWYSNRVKVEKKYQFQKIKLIVWYWFAMIEIFHLWCSLWQNRFSNISFSVLEWYNISEQWILFFDRYILIYFILFFRSLIQRFVYEKTAILWKMDLPTMYYVIIELPKKWAELRSLWAHFRYCAFYVNQM